jgi:single-strand DNA-binding protein
MASYNRVILMGNLTRDPELKYLPSGTAVANFGLAMNETYTDRQTGEKREEVCFVDVEAWGRQAEIANEYLQKGSSVFVDGSLKFDSWEADDGTKRNRLKVRAFRFQFIGGRQDGDGDGGGGGAYDQAAPASAPASAPSSPEFSGEQGPPATTDDDIPF